MAVRISTPAVEITAAQFVLGFDSTVAVFRSARVGTGIAALGFDIWNVNPDPHADSAGGNAAVLVQLYGGASSSFSGDVEAVVLTFALTDSTCRTSPLCFDAGSENTRLVTRELGTVCSPSLILDQGQVSTLCAPFTPLRTAKSSAVLWQNVPNPCHAGTTIAFSTSASGPVQLRILSADGRLVRLLQDAILPDGIHEVRWNGLDAQGRPAPAGVYFYQLWTSDTRASRRLQLLR